MSQIYPLEFQLKKANTSDTEASVVDLHSFVSNDIVSPKIYNKHDNYDFKIVIFQFLVCNVPRSTSYVVYISQLIRFEEHLAILQTSTKFFLQMKIYTYCFPVRTKCRILR